MNEPKNKQANNRILLVLDTSHGQIGGTEQNTLRFAHALAKKGYVPIIAEAGSSILHKSTDADGLQIYCIPTEHFEDVSWKKWRELLKKCDPLIIIRSKTWIGCVNWKLDIAARLSNACYLGWEHHPARAPDCQPPFLKYILTFDFRQLTARVKGFFRTQLHIKAVKQAIAVSHAVREPLINFYPANPNKIDVVYPGIDFEVFTRQNLAREQLRMRWNIPQLGFVIGSLGRLVAHKGNDFTLKVIAELLRQDPALDVWCVLAGKGSDLVRLEALAKSLGIEERVRFPGWQENAPAAWSALDVFMMPSSDEGLGMTLIEAVACGCLPLGATVGGMKEILRGSLKQYCLPLQDLDSWATAVANIIRTPSRERALLHQNAYAQLKEQFDSKRQWNLMVSWIEQHAGAGALKLP